MTVYVDDMRLPATVGCITARWSHLLADTAEELHAFAARLGLDPEWIQHPGTHREHYDVTDQARDQALALGARQLSYPREVGEYLTRKRDGGTTHHAMTDALGRPPLTADRINDVIGEHVHQFHQDKVTQEVWTGCICGWSAPNRTLGKTAWLQHRGEAVAQALSAALSPLARHSDHAPKDERRQATAGTDTVRGGAA